MGRTVANNLSRPDIFPEEAQEMEADHLDRRLSPCGKRVETGGWEKFGYLTGRSQMTTCIMQICWGTGTESEQEQFTEDWIQT